MGLRNLPKLSWLWLNELYSAASLHHILQHKESYPDTMVSYFYFDFNDTDKQSSKKAIRSLLFQFALQVSDIIRKLERLYQNCSNGQHQPAEDVFPLMLKEVIARQGEKYIILDALDECTDRGALLSFLLELTASKPCDLHILATSRREKDIDEELSSVANHNVSIQSAVVDEDIHIYVRDLMATDKKLKKWSDPVKNEIITALMEKAGGMYG